MAKCVSGKQGVLKEEEMKENYEISSHKELINKTWRNI